MSRKLTIVLGIVVMLTGRSMFRHRRRETARAGGLKPDLCLIDVRGGTGLDERRRGQADRRRLDRGTIDLGPNWREMKKDLTEGFSGKCLLSFSCTGADPLNGATVSLSCIDVPHQTKTRWSTTA
jgi:hypothetical protein